MYTIEVFAEQTTLQTIDAAAIEGTQVFPSSRVFGLCDRRYVIDFLQQAREWSFTSVGMIGFLSAYEFHFLSRFCRRLGFRVTEDVLNQSLTIFPI